MGNSSFTRMTPENYSLDNNQDILQGVKLDQDQKSSSETDLSSSSDPKAINNKGDTSIPDEIAKSVPKFETAYAKLKKNAQEVVDKFKTERGLKNEDDPLVCFLVSL